MLLLKYLVFAFIPKKGYGAKVQVNVFLMIVFKTSNILKLSPIATQQTNQIKNVAFKKVIDKYDNSLAVVTSTATIEGSKNKLTIKRQKRVPATLN